MITTIKYGAIFGIILSCMTFSSFAQQNKKTLNLQPTLDNMKKISVCQGVYATIFRLHASASLMTLDDGDVAFDNKVSAKAAAIKFTILENTMTELIPQYTTNIANRRKAIQKQTLTTIQERIFLDFINGDDGRYGLTKLHNLEKLCDTQFWGNEGDQF